MQQLPKYLYKVLTHNLWEQSLGKEALLLPPEDDAFIHLSTQEQLERILLKYWAITPKYVIVKIDPNKLIGRLAYETNHGGTTKYYHLYDGSIPHQAIIESNYCVRKL